jgi:hypothetical protein
MTTMNGRTDDDDEIELILELFTTGRAKRVRACGG